MSDEAMVVPVAENQLAVDSQATADGEREHQHSGETTFGPSFAANVEIVDLRDSEEHHGEVKAAT